MTFEGAAGTWREIGELPGDEIEFLRAQADELNETRRAETAQMKR